MNCNDHIHSGLGPYKSCINFQLVEVDMEF